MKNVLRYIIGAVIMYLLLFGYGYRKPSESIERPVVRVIETVTKEVKVKVPVYVTRYVTKETQCIIQHREPVTRRAERTVKLNRFGVGIGVGPNAINTKYVSNNVEVSLANRAIVAMSFDRLINREISLGVQMQSNSTFLLRAGLEF